MTHKAGHTFTAGPWVVSETFAIGPAGEIVACTPNNHPRREANARLIAAAPDLLEVCQDLWCAFSDTDDPVLRTIAIKARAAIALATAGGAL